MNNPPFQPGDKAEIILGEDGFWRNPDEQRRLSWRLIDAGVICTIQKRKRQERACRELWAALPEGAAMNVTKSGRIWTAEITPVEGGPTFRAVSQYRLSDAINGATTEALKSLRQAIA